MGKVFGILLLVLGIWVAAEYASGNDPLARVRSGDAVETESIVKRSGTKVQDAYDQGGARLEAMLEE